MSGLTRTGGRMREVKFRGKRITGGRWLYGSLCITNWTSDKKKRYFIATGLGNYTFEHEVVPETVGQYTGLKDKNGKEIWEGDIVRYKYESKPAVIRFGEGFQGEPADGMYPYQGWYTDGWVYRFAFDGEDMEVIGNIYENSDLLEEEE